MFPNASITHLPRLTSDHHPILLNLLGNTPRRQPHPFEFELMWLHHSGFKPMLTSFLNTPTQNRLYLPQLLHTLQHKLASWDKSTFGNVFKRNTKILEQIHRVQISLYPNPHPNLFNTEWSLLQSYHRVIEEEKDFWAIRSNGLVPIC